MTLDLTEEEAALLLKQLNGIIDGTITSRQTAPAMSRRVPNYRVSALLPLDAAVHGVQLRSQLLTPASFEKSGLAALTGGFDGSLTRNV